MTRSVTEPVFSVEEIRRQFPAFEKALGGKRLVYLDSACTALKPRRVIERMQAFYESSGACSGKRSTHLLAQAVEEQAVEARRTAAQFLGAESPNEIVFTSGTTEAANLVARAFPYEPGRKEVVLSDLEHNAVFLPFYEAAQRGEATLKFLRSREGRIDPADAAEAISDKTALVAMTHASNVAGGVQPLAEIARLAHARGARLFVDDAQYVSSHRENARALNADFIAFSAHKIGGPFGLGVLYGKEQELNRLRHYKVGGGSVKSVSWTGEMPEVRYLDAPMRFEPGVANFGALPGLTEAIRFSQAIPETLLRSHLAGLVRRAVEGLTRFPVLRLVGSAGDLEEGSLVSFYPIDERFSLADFNLYLNHELAGHFIALRTGEHCAHLLHQSYKIPATMRLSFFAYNTAEEVDLFLSALESYSKEALS